MKKTLYTVVILLLINITLFFFRNNGFEYRKFSTPETLCSSNETSSSVIKWNKSNERYTPAELNEGAELLKKETRVFSTSKIEERAVMIAGWLYNHFSYYEQGHPKSFMDSLTPLQQFHAVLKNRSPVWCGNYQIVFGFFCTVAGIKNRYIQVVDMKAPPDNHVVNEVFLPEHGKWALADVTYNRLIVWNEKGVPVCAAEYYDMLTNKKNGSLVIASLDSGSVSRKIVQASGIRDLYFNRDHRLHYYYETDIKKSYSLSNKLKRYFFPAPWYEIYPRLPGENNYLFYLKQFLAISLLLSLLLLVYLSIKKFL